MDQAAVARHRSEQWKRERTRFAELQRRGVGRDLAARTAAARVAHGASQTAPHSPLRCQTPSLVHSAWLPSQPRAPHNSPNRRTRTSGGVGGAKSRDFPYPNSWAALSQLDVTGLGLRGVRGAEPDRNRTATIPSSRTPAFSHLWIRRMTRRGRSVGKMVAAAHAPIRSRRATRHFL